jgi:O-antigen ligase
VLSFTAPLYWLLAFNVLLVVTAPGTWDMAGIFFDPEDLVYMAVILKVVFAARDPGTARQRIPYLPLWLLLVGVFSISYLLAPSSQQYLTDPVRIAYQLYRYAVKPLLFYPFAAVFLSDPRTTRAMVFTTVGAGFLCALQSIPEGYAGSRAGGPLGSPNALGAALVVPIVFTFVLLIVWATTAKRRVLLVVCMLVLLRGLLFSGSRGALAASLFGLGLAGFFLFQLRGTRSTLIRFVVPIALLAVLIVMIPGVLQRPNIQRALSLGEVSAEESTLQWRIDNRWGHFLEKAWESPWFGIGTDVDMSLGASANTPHNGFIAVAVKRGFPAIILYVVFSVLAIVAGVRLIRGRHPNPWGPITGVLCVTSISALLIHNVVESNFEAPFLSKLLWMYIALALVAGRSLAQVPLGAPVPRRAPPSRRVADRTPATDPG